MNMVPQTMDEFLRVTYLFYDDFRMDDELKIITIPIL